MYLLNLQCLGKHAKKAAVICKVILLMKKIFCKLPCPVWVASHDYRFDTVGSEVLSIKKHNKLMVLYSLRNTAEFIQIKMTHPLPHKIILVVTMSLVAFDVGETNSTYKLLSYYSYLVTETVLKLHLLLPTSFSIV